MASTLHPATLQMLHKAGRDPSVYSPRTTAPRPLSDATEMFDTDFEEDAEDVENGSPRASSINSSGKTSLSTVDSYDEAVTPISNHFASFDFQLNDKPVEGPRGPHLFRASQISSTSVDFHLSMSPLTPKEPTIRPETAFRVHPTLPVPDSIPKTNRSADTIPHSYDGYADVRDWSPQQVAMWMYDAGFEDTVVERFQSNDISGAILVDLKFEDLKELDIQSFGKRHRLWGEIQRLRGSPMSSPVEESPSFSDGHSPSFRSPQDDCFTPVGENVPGPRRRESRNTRRRRGTPADTVISPAESVSIVGIEQLIPKPHKCSKGENCSKYRRQQRQLALLAEEQHPVSPEQGGHILITGDPGNAAIAESMFRPVSEAVPSVVASSDVLGPGQRPVIQLQPENLRVIQSRDPQENVKQFLDFQHMRSATTPPEMPSSPPYEMFPPLQSPPMTRPSVQESLRSLPKLTIPLSRANTVTSATKTVVPPSARIDRFGTPSSAMDVPVTAIPLGPVARDFSQSVPPDMQYRRGTPQSTAKGAGGAHRTDSWQPSTRMARVDEDVQLEAVEGPEEPMINGNDVNHAGWMKKRKTKFLRHEWHEHHFTLNGTSMICRDDPRSSTVLESIDVDDYAVACSSLASNNKLSAAFKAMKLSGKRDIDSAAFAFQLVPATEKKGIKQPIWAATGKTHHFATSDRESRLIWLRQLMIAKALKQKGDGYEININGKTMI